MPVITPHVPEGLIDLMKALAKSVLKEKPENIFEFAAVHFENLLIKRDGELDKGYKKFKSSEKYIEAREKCLFSQINNYQQKKKKPEALSISAQDKMENINPELLSPQSLQNKFRPRKLSSKKASEILLAIKEEDEHASMSDEVTIQRQDTAAGKIQKAFKTYMKRKLAEKVDEKIGKLSEDAAAMIIQRTLRKLFAKRYQKDDTNPKQLYENSPEVHNSDQRSDNSSSNSSNNSNKEKHPNELKQPNNTSMEVGEADFGVKHEKYNAPDVDNNRVNTQQIPSIADVEMEKKVECSDVGSAIISETNTVGNSESLVEKVDALEKQAAQNSEKKKAIVKLQSDNSNAKLASTPPDSTKSNPEVIDSANVKYSLEHTNVGTNSTNTNDFNLDENPIQSDASTEEIETSTSSSQPLRSNSVQNKNRKNQKINEVDKLDNQASSQNLDSPNIEPQNSALVNSTVKNKDGMGKSESLLNEHNSRRASDSQQQNLNNSTTPDTISADPFLVETARSDVIENTITEHLKLGSSQNNTHISTIETVQNIEQTNKNKSNQFNEKSGAIKQSLEDKSKTVEPVSNISSTFYETTKEISTKESGKEETLEENVGFAKAPNNLTTSDEKPNAQKLNTISPKTSEISEYDKSRNLLENDSLKNKTQADIKETEGIEEANVNDIQIVKPHQVESDAETFDQLEGTRRSVWYVGSDPIVATAPKNNKSNDVFTEREDNINADEIIRGSSENSGLVSTERSPELNEETSANKSVELIEDNNDLEPPDIKSSNINKGSLNLSLYDNGGENMKDENINSIVKGSDNNLINSKHIEINEMSNLPENLDKTTEVGHSKTPVSGSQTHILKHNEALENNVDKVKMPQTDTILLNLDENLNLKENLDIVANPMKPIDSKNIGEMNLKSNKKITNSYKTEQQNLQNLSGVDSSEENLEIGYLKEKEEEVVKDNENLENTLPEKTMPVKQYSLDNSNNISTDMLTSEEISNSNNRPIEKCTEKLDSHHKESKLEFVRNNSDLQHSVDLESSLQKQTDNIKINKADSLQKSADTVKMEAPNMEDRPQNTANAVKAEGANMDRQQNTADTLNMETTNMEGKPQNTADTAKIEGSNKQDSLQETVGTAEVEGLNMGDSLQKTADTVKMEGPNIENRPQNAADAVKAEGPNWVVSLQNSASIVKIDEPNTETETQEKADTVKIEGPNKKDSLQRTTDTAKEEGYSIQDSLQKTANAVKVEAANMEDSLQNTADTVKIKEPNEENSLQKKAVTVKIERPNMEDSLQKTADSIKMEDSPQITAHIVTTEEPNTESSLQNTAPAVQLEGPNKEDSLQSTADNFKIEGPNIVDSLQKTADTAKIEKPNREDSLQRTANPVKMEGPNMEDVPQNKADAVKAGEPSMKDSLQKTVDTVKMEKENMEDSLQAPPHTVVTEEPNMEDSLQNSADTVKIEAPNNEQNADNFKKEGTNKIEDSLQKSADTAEIEGANMQDSLQKTSATVKLEGPNIEDRPSNTTHSVTIEKQNMKDSIQNTATTVKIDEPYTEVLENTAKTVQIEGRNKEDNTRDNFKVEGPIEVNSLGKKAVTTTIELSNMENSRQKTANTVNMETPNMEDRPQNKAHSGTTEEPNMQDSIENTAATVKIDKPNTEDSPQNTADTIKTEKPNTKDSLLKKSNTVKIEEPTMGGNLQDTVDNIKIAEPNTEDSLQNIGDTVEIEESVQNATNNIKKKGQNVEEGNLTKLEIERITSKEENLENRSKEHDDQFQSKFEEHESEKPNNVTEDKNFAPERLKEQVELKMEDKSQIIVSAKGLLQNSSTLNYNQEEIELQKESDNQDKSKVNYFSENQQINSNLKQNVNVGDSELPPNQDETPIEDSSLHLDIQKEKKSNNTLLAEQNESNLQSRKSSEHIPIIKLENEQTKNQLKHNDLWVDKVRSIEGFILESENKDNEEGQLILEPKEKDNSNNNKNDANQNQGSITTDKPIYEKIASLNKALPAMNQPDNNEEKNDSKKVCADREVNADPETKEVKNDSLEAEAQHDIKISNENVENLKKIENQENKLQNEINISKVKNIYTENHKNRSSDKLGKDVKENSPARSREIQENNKREELKKDSSNFHKNEKTENCPASSNTNQEDSGRDEENQTNTKIANMGKFETAQKIEEQFPEKPQLESPDAYVTSDGETPKVNHAGAVVSQKNPSIEHDTQVNITKEELTGSIENLNNSKNEIEVNSSESKSNTKITDKNSLGLQNEPSKSSDNVIKDTSTKPTIQNIDEKHTIKETKELASTFTTPDKSHNQLEIKDALHMSLPAKANSDTNGPPTKTEPNSLVDKKEEITEEPFSEKRYSHLTGSRILSADLSDAETTRAESRSTINDELSEIENIDISTYGEDSLEAMYYSLRKNEIMLDRMQKQASERKSASNDREPLGKFDEQTFRQVKSMDELQRHFSTNSEDDVVIKNMDNQSTSDKKPGVLFSDENFGNPISIVAKNTEKLLENMHKFNINPPQIDNDSDSDDEKNKIKPLRDYSPSIRMKSGALTPVREHPKSVSFESPIQIAGKQSQKFMERIHGEYRSVENLDNILEQNGTKDAIQKKMLAYSISEADSDYYELPEEKSNAIHDDFNISTALETASTDTDSTIVSAATKIQAGARGFLTRRRLRRASVGAIPFQSDRKASFGNEAIGESLEDLIEQGAASKIQKSYRQYYNRKTRQSYPNVRESLNISSSSKNGSGDGKVMGITEVKLEQKSSVAPGGTSSDDNRANDENKRLHDAKSSTIDVPSERSSTDDVYQGLNLAARRLTLQRGDAMQMYSTPDDENGDPTGTQPNTETPSEKRKAVKSDTLRHFGLRQRTMPVQIESEIFRIVPKHMRKRIKSADIHKKKRNDVQ